MENETSLLASSMVLDAQMVLVKAMFGVLHAPFRSCISDTGMISTEFVSDLLAKDSHTDRIEWQIRFYPSLWLRIDPSIG